MSDDAGRLPASAGHRPRFGTERRGYDRAEVDEYLGFTERELTRLASENRQLHDQLTEAKASVERLESAKADLAFVMKWIAEHGADAGVRLDTPDDPR